MDMKQMMRQAQKMQAELAKAQEEIKTMTAEATAGGGMVKVVAQGDMTVQSITIDPAAIDPEDADMLQDMVCAAVNEALLDDPAQVNEAPYEAWLIKVSEVSDTEALLDAEGYEAVVAAEEA